ncbi:MAG: SGNH/GDSL hydrolase family protein [Spirochaetes bacterium]|nr:SGNH/GDSL hydrolase family protein [Spirochaetota bacterium]
MKKSIKNLLINISIFTVTLMVLLLLLEGFFRITSQQWKKVNKKVVANVNFFRPDKRFGWLGKPDFSGLASNDYDFVAEVKLNSLGFRDKEHNYTTKTKKRILILGDSFFWGWGVEYDKILPSLLQKKIPKYDILNCAVTGFSTDQEYLYLKEKGRVYKPNFVIAGLYIGNDIQDNNSTRMNIYSKPKFNLNNNVLILTNFPISEEDMKHKVKITLINRIHKFLYYKSALYNLSIKMLKNNFILKKLILSMFFRNKKISKHHLEYEFEIMEKKSSPLIKKSWAITEKLLEKMNQYCRDKLNAHLIIILIPTKTQIYEENYKSALFYFNKKKEDYDRLLPNKKLIRICKKYNILYLDPIKAIKINKDRNKIYFRHDIHWTEEGHQFISVLFIKKFSHLLK